MSKITIKIVEVDQESQTVVIKYASEDSKKSIDDYPPVAFQISNYGVSTPEEFIEKITPQVTYWLLDRDAKEKSTTNVNVSTWLGHEATVNSLPLPTPMAPPIEGLADSEVIL